MNTNKPNLTYADAGVDITTGNEFIDHIKPIAAKTKRPEVVSGLGGFGALFELPVHKYKQPILVSSTDGVGTKLKLALSLNKHDTIGIDLVAMCVNDLVVQGAEPLFFLDYFATSRLDLSIGKAIMTGIGKGCALAGAALTGGETAEMPGLYQGNDYDLAGFTVGVVEKDKIIDGSKVSVGDVIIGLASSGVHSNGFSLVRKVLEVSHAALDMPFEDSTLGDTLLEPTRIYVKPLLELISKVDVHAMAHITGGGLIENLPRVMPTNTQAILNPNSWQRPEIFNWIQTRGNIADSEMHRTFNCGIGMAVCVAQQDVAQTLSLLKDAGETAWQIGVIEDSSSAEPSVLIEP
jgi:phosphoribosylformylglycinamidine cyclo-ligase